MFNQRHMELCVEIYQKHDDDKLALACANIITNQAVFRKQYIQKLLSCAKSDIGKTGMGKSKSVFVVLNWKNNLEDPKAGVKPEKVPMNDVLFLVLNSDSDCNLVNACLPCTENSIVSFVKICVRVMNDKNHALFSAFVRKFSEILTIVNQIVRKLNDSAVLESQILGIVKFGLHLNDILRCKSVNDKLHEITVFGLKNKTILELTSLNKTCLIKQAFSQARFDLAKSLINSEHGKLSEDYRFVNHLINAELEPSRNKSLQFYESAITEFRLGMNSTRLVRDKFMLKLVKLRKVWRQSVDESTGNKNMESSKIQKLLSNYLLNF
jgi:hypothetical protein